MSGAMKKGKIAGRLFMHISTKSQRDEEKAEKQREIKEKKAELHQLRLNRKDV